MNGRYRLVTLIVLVFPVFLFGTHLWAGVGLKAGPMVSKMYADFSAACDYKSALGYRGSIFYSIPILETTSLEPGLSFSSESFQYYYVPARNYKDAGVNFLKLNMLVNVRMLPTRFHVIAGPYAAIRIGEEEDYVKNIDLFRAENKNGWGVQMGCRIYFNESTGNSSGLFFELLGDIGLTKFQNEVGVYKTAYYQSKNISFMIGYIF